MASVSGGPKPYEFEPQFTPEELLARRAAAVHADPVPAANNPPSPAAPDRMTTDEWCTCHNCAPIDSREQCVCCWEVGNCDRYLGDEAKCITSHEDFHKICQERAVLRTALVARLDVKGHRAHLPDELDNESYRYAAYRFFTYWVHGVLGRGVRKVIPACAVIAIRETFPTQNGRYKGFQRGANGEEIEVPEQFAI